MRLFIDFDFVHIYVNAGAGVCVKRLKEFPVSAGRHRIAIRSQVKSGATPFPRAIVANMRNPDASTVGKQRHALAGKCSPSIGLGDIADHFAGPAIYHADSPIRLETSA